MINKETKKTSLNELYYNACLEYSYFMQTNNIIHKQKYEQYFNEYKSRGGKKEFLKYIK